MADYVLTFKHCKQQPIQEDKSLFGKIEKTDKLLTPPLAVPLIFNKLTCARVAAMTTKWTLPKILGTL